MLIPGPHEPAAARHAGSARGRSGLQHDRVRRLVPAQVRRAARARTRCCSSTSAAPGAPSRSTVLPSRTWGSPTTSPLVGAASRSGPVLGRLHHGALAADDLAAVAEALGLGPLDLYGDSYGTFFPRSSPAGTPTRSAAWCSTAPTRRTASPAWYPTQGPAMRHAFEVACARSTVAGPAGARSAPPCAQVCRRAPHALARCLPRRRRSRARVTVNARTRSVAYGATYSAGVLPRDDRRIALRAARRPRTAPRLVAEALGGGGVPTRAIPAAYSEGLDAAVACHDYPQVYDMPRPARPCGAAVRRCAGSSRPAPPGARTRPFTVREYTSSDWQMLDWCLRWPVARGVPPGRAGRSTGRVLPAPSPCWCSAVSSTRSPRPLRAR